MTECIIAEVPHSKGRLRKSMCRRHWIRERRYGSPLIVHSSIPPHKELEDHGEWRGTNASYSAFHKRVTSHRGPARDNGGCAREDETCSGPIQWACQGDYGDLNDYVPMCASHNRRDSVSWATWRAEHPAYGHGLAAVVVGPEPPNLVVGPEVMGRLAA